MSCYVGIDLGTTNSVVSIRRGDGFTFVPDDSGNFLIPSVVSYSKEVLVGRDAVSDEDNNPSATVRSSKRHIGKPDVLLAGHSPTEVARDILGFLRAISLHHFGEEISGVVITVPAYFNQNQRLETKKAAEMAGLQVLRIINEPTAAALAYGDDSKLNELILVYDLGGGTFDVTLLEMTDDNVYQVLSTSGDTSLGGDDFDEVICGLITETLPPGFKPFSDFRVRLKKTAEKIKIQLGYKKTINDTIRYSGIIDGKIYHHSFSIDCDVFLREIQGLLGNTKAHVLNVLHDANKRISDLSKIILVGGSTKSPHVRNYIKSQFNVHVHHDIDPDLTVAAGAASLADSITGGKSDKLLIDVTPLSLGIEVKGGVMNKIIPRNATIPCTSQEEFITVEDNQTSVSIKVFQGERPLAFQNEPLGEFELSGFEARPKGHTRIVVKFEIDSSGLIKVSAFDKESGLSANVELLPLTSQKINEHLDSIETDQADIAALQRQIELDSLSSQINTLITQFRLADFEDADEFQETFDSVKGNLNGMRVFAKELQELLLERINSHG